MIVPPTTPEDGPLQIFSGNSNPTLAGRMARSLGIELGRAVVGTFANEETRVRIEQNVRGSDVFVLQSLSIPVDHHIIELCLMIDALKRASARRVTAVIPYYGYAKQEKKMAGREPISAKADRQPHRRVRRGSHSDDRPARTGHRGLFRYSR